MKPLAFDLRNAKKISSDKHSSTFHLKNGHMITVSHAHLPALQRKQIERIPLAEGGNVDDNKVTDYSQVPESLRQGRDQSDVNQVLYNQWEKPKGIHPANSAPVMMAEGGDAVDSSAVDNSTPDARDASAHKLFGKNADKILADVDKYAVPQDQTSISIAPESINSMPSASDAATTDSASSANGLRAKAFNNLDNPPPIPSANANDPYGVQPYYQAQMNALNQGEAGALQENAVNANVGRYKAGLEQQYQTQLQTPFEKYQRSMQDLNTEGNNIASEVSAGKLDPDHYVKNMGAPAKVATALGLLANGFSSGLSGRENFAFNALQQHIQDDISLQKADLGRKQSLLNFNLAKTGNLMLAEKLTEFQTNSIFESKFRSAADQATNQMEQAKNLQASSLFGQKKAELAHQIAVQSAMLGSVPGQSAEQGFQSRMQFLRMNGQDKMADELEKKHVPGLPGQASNEVTPANRDEWRTLSNLQKSYNDAQQFLDNTGKLGAGWQNANKARGKSIMDSMALSMGDLADLKRFTPEEKKIYLDRIPDLTGTHFTNQDQARMSQLQKELFDKSNTFKSSLGYPTQVPAQAPSNSNNEAVNWARQNPNDPRAGRILIKLGVK